MREGRHSRWGPKEEKESGAGREMLHMQEVPRLEEEAALFAWDVAPL